MFASRRGLGCSLLLLLLTACCQTVRGREWQHNPAEQRNQPATGSRIGNDTSNTPSSVPLPASGSQQSSTDSRSRRLLPETSTEPDASVPDVSTAKFKKIAATVSRPLGTALNGSAWMPGACGPHPSAYGYQCSWVAPGGAVLHWTYSSGSSSPPINRCTRQPQAVPNLEIQELDGPTVHFALQAATKEKLHLAFMDPQARLFPSEGVHGRAVDPCNNPATCNTTSTSEVEVLHHSSPGVFWSTGRISSLNPELIQGWAGWAAADTEGQTQVLCVSRHVHTKQMKLGPQNRMELLLQYATSDADNYMSFGQQHGTVAIDLSTGKVTEFKKPTRVLLAHAILMLVAFGVLLPGGLLLARHKWLFWDEEQGLSPLWAFAHFGVLLLCVMVGLSGMIVALARFGNTITGLVMSTHQVLGLLSVGLSVVLVILYGLRPFLVSGQRHGPNPLLTPLKAGGVITIAASWASLFLGCVVMHQNWAAPYLYWLLPCILVTALMACAATLLELRYQKLVRTGAYNPKTCTMTNTGPSIPLARIRTHREPTVPKKQEPEVVGKAHRDSPMIRAVHVGGLEAAAAGSVAATMLARSIGIGQLAGADGSPLSRSSSSAGGRGSSAGGAVRRARHSTPNATALAQVQTGFPSSPRPHVSSSDAA